MVVNRSASLPEPESVRPARFTADQFLRMFDLGIFEDDDVELVHGEIIQLSPAHSPHALMHGRAVFRLVQIYGEDRVLVDCLIRLDGMSVRAFDVTVLRSAAVPGNVLEPHEVLLGVEVAHSSLARDLGEKKLHYAAAGIAHYLVADLNACRLHLMSGPGAEGYGKVDESGFEEGVDLPEGQRLQLS